MSPSFCECYIRAKLRKKNASKDLAVRPNASEPLGQVSLDLIKFKTLATIDGYKCACIFVDGYSQHKHMYLMKTKDEALDALKDYCCHVSTPKQVLTNKDKVFIGNPFAHYCLKNKIDQQQSPAY